MSKNNIYGFDKSYCLQDFDEADVIKAKQYLKSAFLGWLRVRLDVTFDAWFEKMKEMSFVKDDTFTFGLKFNAIGNDILAAIGSAQNSKDENEDDFLKEN